MLVDPRVFLYGFVLVKIFLLFSDDTTTGGFKRGLDRHTIIDGEIFRRNLSSTKEIKIRSRDLAPPTKKLMKGLDLQNEDSTAMFCRPGKPISQSFAYVINFLFLFYIHHSRGLLVASLQGPRKSAQNTALVHYSSVQ